MKIINKEFKRARLSVKTMYLTAFKRLIGFVKLEDDSSDEAVLGDS
jgi:hypothetical protein